MGTQKSGNFTTGRPALQGAFGNQTPEALRSIPRTFAEEKVIPQYNAEATYNEWSNHRAAGHLNALNQHLNNLWETSQNRSVYGAKSSAAQAHEVMSKAGFAAHPDILNTHIPDVIDRLKNIDTSSLPEHARPHLEGAIQSAHEVLGEFHPASVTEFKEHGSDPTKASVLIDPDYRANIFDYKRPQEPTRDLQKASDADWDKQMKTTADGRYALIKQGKMKNPEDSRSEESKRRKAEQRKMKAAALKAQKAGQ